MKDENTTTTGGVWLRIPNPQSTHLSPPVPRPRPSFAPRQCRPLLAYQYVAGGKMGSQGSADFFAPVPRHHLTPRISLVGRDRPPVISPNRGLPSRARKISATNTLSAFADSGQFVQ